MISPIPTRESWLLRAVDLLRPLFRRVHAPLPDRIYISVGFPSTRALSRKNKVVGECWYPESAGDKRHHVFISPLKHDPVEVLEIIVHELVHAAVGKKEKHKGRFKRIAVELGLRGKMTATRAGDELKAELEVAAKTLGKYPHGGLSPSQRPEPKQATRLLKLVCGSGGCADENGDVYVLRVTRKWIELAGYPVCPCGGTFELDVELKEKGRKGRRKKVRL